MKNLSLFIVFIITVFFTLNASAQYEPRGEKYNETDANTFFDDGNYYDAVPLYELLIIEKPKKLDYQLKAAVCYYKLGNDLDKSISLLQGVFDKKPATQNVLYYLAKAYAINYQFDIAITTFETAQASMVTSMSYKNMIPSLIQQCKNGKELVKDSLHLEIVNMGGYINTSANEYSPSINADETMLVFTYRGVKSVGERQDKYNKATVNGSYNEDIYKAEFISNTWTQSVSISDSINTKLNEAAISISEDGNTLYLYKDTKGFSGDIYESDKVNGKWSEPKRLAMNSKYWEGHAAVNPDGNFMIFSSNRPGGFGGKDLYSATLLEDGNWGNIKNLGASINTKLDEDAPFFQPAGDQFNFSSKGHNSMGGYDIFEAKINKDSTYSKPINIGYPINTTSNDIFYSTSKKGNIYFSSARKGGFGQNDIYQIINDGMTITGVVMDDRNPSKPIANLVVSITNKSRTLNITDTTDADGNYQFSNLPADEYYLLFLEEEDVSLVDSNFVIEGVVTMLGKAKKDIAINEVITDNDGKFKLLVAKRKVELNELSETEINEKYGSQTAEKLVFVVQVAALKNPKYFECGLISSYGKINKVMLDDGLTRFTIGEFRTLNEAKELLKLVKEKGREDAFILLMINGKRTYLLDLVGDGVFK